MNQDINKNIIQTVAPAIKLIIKNRNSVEDSIEKNISYSQKTNFNFSRQNNSNINLTQSISNDSIILKTQRNIYPLSSTSNESLNHMPSTPLSITYRDNNNEIDKTCELLCDSNYKSNLHCAHDDFSNSWTKPGGYAVTTIQSMPWLKTPIQGKKLKSKKTIIVTKIINENFSKCLPYIEDPYWKGLFTDASYGKFPRGFSYKNYVLTHRKRSKTDIIELSRNPTEMISACISFFRNTAVLRSTADLERERQNHEECLSKSVTICKGNWNGIRSKSVKRALLAQFVYDISKTLELNTDQQKHLKTIVSTGFLLGYFSYGSVQFGDGSITGIKGLEWNESNKTFIINPILSETPKINKLKDWIKEDEYLSPEYKIIVRYIKWISFMKLWTKFISTFGTDSYGISNGPKLIII